MNFIILFKNKTVFSGPILVIISIMLSFTFFGYSNTIVDLSLVAIFFIGLVLPLYMYRRILSKHKAKIIALGVAVVSLSSFLYYISYGLIGVPVLLIAYKLANSIHKDCQPSACGFVEGLYLTAIFYFVLSLYALILIYKKSYSKNERR